MCSVQILFETHIILVSANIADRSNIPNGTESLTSLLFLVSSIFLALLVLSTSLAI
jgi:hypothetical protein